MADEKAPAKAPKRPRKVAQKEPAKRPVDTPPPGKRFIISGTYRFLISE